MLKTFVIIALMLSLSSGLLAEEKGGVALPRVSEKIRAEWQRRYDRAENRRHNGWYWFAAGTTMVALGAWDYSRRFDQIAVPGASYDVINCSGGTCINTVIQEPASLSKVENPGRRNVAIGFLTAARHFRFGASVESEVAVLKCGIWKISAENGEPSPCSPDPPGAGG